MMTRKLFYILDNFDYSNELEIDVFNVLYKFDKEKTFEHVKAVSEKALEISTHYNVYKRKIYRAALLHDISAIVPKGIRLSIARDLGIQEIKQDDIDNPIMLHGKISAKLAEKYFRITDIETLDAMKYHTTLRENASLVEQIVFIADKIELDPTAVHKAEYMDNVVQIVNQDVTKACWYYLDWMFENLEELGWQRHYDAVVAYEWLNS